MSMEYCEYCDTTIDTDFDAEHFEVGGSRNMTLCEEERIENPEWLKDKQIKTWAYHPDPYE